MRHSVSIQDAAAQVWPQRAQACLPGSTGSSWQQCLHGRPGHRPRNRLRAGRHWGKQQVSAWPVPARGSQQLQRCAPHDGEGSLAPGLVHAQGDGLPAAAGCLHIVHLHPSGREPMKVRPARRAGLAQQPGAHTSAMVSGFWKGWPPPSEAHSSRSSWIFMWCQGLPSSVASAQAHPGGQRRAGALQASAGLLALCAQKALASGSRRSEVNLASEPEGAGPMAPGRGLRSPQIAWSETTLLLFLREWACDWPASALTADADLANRGPDLSFKHTAGQAGRSAAGSAGRLSERTGSRQGPLSGSRVWACPLLVGARRSSGEPGRCEAVWQWPF